MIIKHIGISDAEKVLDSTYANGYNEYCFSLKALEDYEINCRAFLNSDGYLLDSFSLPMVTVYPDDALWNYSWFIDYGTCTIAPSLPKFKEGDVIVYTEKFDTRFAGKWVFEEGEKFYVRNVSGASYSLRVLFSADDAQKDFWVNAEDIDSKCECLKNVPLAALSHTPPTPAKESAPYFPSLSQFSHV